jgi:hypothetical protein
MDEKTINYIMLLYVASRLTYEEISSFYDNEYSPKQIKEQIDLYMSAPSDRTISDSEIERWKRKFGY